MLLGTQAGLGLVSADLGAAVLTGDVRLWQVVVLAALFGILSAVDNPAHTGVAARCPTRPARGTPSASAPPPALPPPSSAAGTRRARLGGTMNDRVVDRAAAHATRAELAVRDWLPAGLSFATGCYEATA